MAQMTVADAARSSGLSLSTVQQAAKRGAIVGAKLFGKTWVFEDSAFWQWCDNRPRRGRPKHAP